MQQVVSADLNQYADHRGNMGSTVKPDSLANFQRADGSVFAWQNIPHNVVASNHACSENAPINSELVHSAAYSHSRGQQSSNSFPHSYQSVLSRQRTDSLRYQNQTQCFTDQMYSFQHTQPPYVHQHQASSYLPEQTSEISPAHWNYHAPRPQIHIQQNQQPSLFHNQLQKGFPLIPSESLKPNVSFKPSILRYLMANGSPADQFPPYVHRNLSTGTMRPAQRGTGSSVEMSSHSSVPKPTRVSFSGIQTRPSVQESSSYQSRCTTYITPAPFTQVTSTQSSDLRKGRHSGHSNISDSFQQNHTTNPYSVFSLATWKESNMRQSGTRSENVSTENSGNSVRPAQWYRHPDASFQSDTEAIQADVSYGSATALSLSPLKTQSTESHRVLKEKPPSLCSQPENTSGQKTAADDQTGLTVSMADDGSVTCRSEVQPHGNPECQPSSSSGDARREAHVVIERVSSLTNYSGDNSSSGMQDINTGTLMTETSNLPFTEEGGIGSLSKRDDISLLVIEDISLSGEKDNCLSVGDDSSMLAGKENSLSVKDDSSFIGGKGISMSVGKDDILLVAKDLSLSDGKDRLPLEVCSLSVTKDITVKMSVTKSESQTSSFSTVTEVSNKTTVLKKQLSVLANNADKNAELQSEVDSAAGNKSPNVDGQEYSKDRQSCSHSADLASTADSLNVSEIEETVQDLFPSKTPATSKTTGSSTNIATCSEFEKSGILSDQKAFDNENTETVHLAPGQNRVRVNPHLSKRNLSENKQEVHSTLHKRSNSQKHPVIRHILETGTTSKGILGNMNQVQGASRQSAAVQQQNLKQSGQDEVRVLSAREKVFNMWKAGHVADKSTARCRKPAGGLVSALEITLQTCRNPCLKTSEIGDIPLKEKSSEKQKKQVQSKSAFRATAQSSTKQKGATVTCWPTKLKQSSKAKTQVSVICYAMFHGHKLICLKSETESHILLCQFQFECFLGKGIGNVNNCIDQILRIKKKPLNHPEKEKILRFLKRHGYHIDKVQIITLNEARQIYHHMFGIEKCSEATCVIELPKAIVDLDEIDIPSTREVNLREKIQQMAVAGKNSETLHFRSNSKSAMKAAENKKQNLNVLEDVPQSSTEKSNLHPAMTLPESPNVSTVSSDSNCTIAYGKGRDTDGQNDLLSLQSSLNCNTITWVEGSPKTDGFCNTFIERPRCYTHSGENFLVVEDLCRILGSSKFYEVAAKEKIIFYSCCQKIANFLNSVDSLHPLKSVFHSLVREANIITCILDKKYTSSQNSGRKDSCLSLKRSLSEQEVLNEHCSLSKKPHMDDAAQVSETHNLITFEQNFPQKEFVDIALEVDGNPDLKSKIRNEQFRLTVDKIIDEMLSSDTERVETVTDESTIEMEETATVCEKTTVIEETVIAMEEAGIRAHKILQRNLMGAADSSDVCENNGKSQCTTPPSSVDPLKEMSQSNGLQFALGPECPLLLESRADMDVSSVDICDQDGIIFLRSESVASHLSCTSGFSAGEVSPVLVDDGEIFATKENVISTTSKDGGSGKRLDSFEEKIVLLLKRGKSSFGVSDNTTGNVESLSCGRSQSYEDLVLYDGFRDSEMVNCDEEKQAKDTADDCQIQSFPATWVSSSHDLEQQDESMSLSACMLSPSEDIEPAAVTQLKLFGNVRSTDDADLVAFGCTAPPSSYRRAYARMWQKCRMLQDEVAMLKRDIELTKTEKNNWNKMREFNEDLSTMLPKCMKYSTS